MGETNDTSKGTILIVEDNPINMQLLNDLLTVNNYEVLKAFHAKEALEIIGIHKANIDLMLVDIQLPEMDGFTLIENIKKDPEVKDIAIYIVSAHVLESDREKASKFGCNGYINKPINITAFINEIELFFSKHNKT